MTSLTKLLERNKNWAKKVSKEKPDFFDKLSQQQKPDYLWIGCSDSRVSENQIVDLPAGKIFVHRNIANQFLQGDMNSNSVLQYAVETLNINHIILCGHYSCGGVLTAFEDSYNGLVDHWVENINIIKCEYQESLDKIKEINDQVNALCELNVIYQVRNIYSSDVVRRAWASDSNLYIHGLIYKLTDGNLIDLNISITNQKDLNNVFKNAVNAVFDRYIK
ncbi:MAG: carbonic anhydrase [Planctomycetota bacterium]|nr:MAG: carbonic anhydrase [Planctomycetota bacterium]